VGCGEDDDGARSWRVTATKGAGDEDSEGASWGRQRLSAIVREVEGWGRKEEVNSQFSQEEACVGFCD